MTEPGYETPSLSVHVLLTNANDGYADVTVAVELLPGDCIPDVLLAAAKTAAEQAWDRKVPKLRPVTLDQHGNARQPLRLAPDTSKVSP